VPADAARHPLLPPGITFLVTGFQKILSMQPGLIL